MGEVKHTSSFLRTSLVRDPYCLGDFLEAKDILRIESEYPEFFKSRAVAAAKCAAGPTNPSLHYSKPASGSPYKHPVVPKSCLRSSNSSSTVQKSLIISKRKVFDSDDGGPRQQQSYPHINICTRKHLPSPKVPLKNTSERSLGPSLAPPKKTLRHSISTQTKPTTSKVSPRTKAETTQGRPPPSSPVQTKQRILGKAKTAEQTHHPESPSVSVTHMGRICTPCPKRSTPSPMNRIVKNGSPTSLLPRLLAGSRQRDPQGRSSGGFFKNQASGFIRPTFSKNTTKRKPSTPSQFNQPVGETGDYSVSMDRKPKAKYVEILEISQLERKDDGGDGWLERLSHHKEPRSPSKTLSVPCSSAAVDAKAVRNLCVSRSEQALLAELLAVEYTASGKFRKKLIPSKPSFSEGSVRQKPSAAATENGPGTPRSFRITGRQKMLLEKIAKQLIQKEMRTCLSGNGGGLQEVSVMTLKDETPTTCTGETVELYKEGIKEVIDVGIGRQGGIVQDDSSDEEFLSATAAAEVHVPAKTGLGKTVDPALEDPAHSNNGVKERNHDQLNPVEVTDKSATTPTASGSNLVEEENMDPLVSISPSEDYSSSFDEDTGDEEVEEEEVDEEAVVTEMDEEVDILEAKVDDVVSQEDSISVLVKEFPILSTIFEEAVISGKSETTCSPSFVAESAEGKEPAVPRNNEARSSDILQKSNADKLPTDTNNCQNSDASLAKLLIDKTRTETNNVKKSNVSVPKPTSDKVYAETNIDVTDCSSISEFIMSDAKSPSKPMTSLSKDAVQSQVEQRLSVIDSEEPPMSLSSKIEKLLENGSPSEQLPEGLKNESIISFHKVGSIPEAGPVADTSESVVSSPPETEDESVFEDSISGESGVSYRHICTNNLSHGELLVDQDKSTGEISWSILHSPGLRGGLLRGGGFLNSEELSTIGTETD